MANQLLKSWNQSQATRDNRLTGTAWGAQYGQIGGTDPDANGTSEDVVLFKKDYLKWKSWNLTNVTRKWHDGTATNYGVLIWATNEDTDGYDIRFRRSEDSVDQPVLEITYSEDLKTVYFLKDHLGSVRATVDADTDTVVGYDDYDAWGYILAGRSMTTPWSSVQGTAKNKFTGKEWDDEFGLDWNYFGARYYDPEIGRWLSVDPLRGTTTPRDLLRFPDFFVSPYTYVLNNPPKNIDPNGLHTLSVGVGAIGQVVFAGGHASLSVIADFKGNVGLSLTIGRSVGVGIGGGIGAVGQYASAETIYDTVGPTNTGGIYSPAGGVEFNQLVAEDSEGNVIGEMTAWGISVSTPSAGGGVYGAAEETFVVGTTWEKLGSILADVAKGTKFVVDKTGRLIGITENGDRIDTGLYFDITRLQEQNEEENKDK